MSIVIISASQRLQSESFKVSRYIQAILLEVFEVQANVLDLADIVLPFWTDHADAKELQASQWAPIRRQLELAVGLVIVSPEWSGGITPALKNFFLYCTNHELADKPAYLVSVTSSYTGGVYPLAELRLSSHKNTHICFIPEQLTIHSVQHVLNQKETANESDFNVRVRLQYGLGVLLNYASCMIELRKCNFRDFDAFPYGV
jgi:NAD(P)H-dependent FMN reductase